MANRVIHFEIQADDLNRAKNFYEKALGWKITQAMTKEQGGMDYWSLDTGKGPGIGGGMYQRPKSGDKLYTYDCTIAVEDIDKAIDAVKKNGGTIDPNPDGKDKGMIPGVGWFAKAKDPEGNKFGLMQATDWKPN
ncbi:VOC family protein [Candidatus Parcubacteria bacterium]|nr:VOC family protein [Candidatus Parcubacteria bacterium]